MRRARAWLGSTPEVYYTEIRVHPQDGSFDRPGWLRCEQFGAGMITGWGAHHVDIAHWGMDMEHSGPVEIWGSAEFPKRGLWDVHGPFETHARYANGVTMTISGALPNGVKFIGDKGWIFVTRGKIEASAPELLKKELPAGAQRLYVSNNHMGNFFECVRSRKAPICGTTPRTRWRSPGRAVRSPPRSRSSR